jgi:hypothetical protein
LTVPSAYFTVPSAYFAALAASSGPPFVEVAKALIYILFLS